MSERILIVLPTRGRPWSALEAIASIKKTASQPERVHLLVCQDSDDSFFSFDFGQVVCVQSARKRFVGTVNFWADWHRCDWIAWAGDDLRYQSHGWDDIVESHKELVVYGEDGIHNEKMATHPFVRSAIPKALDYLIPKELVHLCADTFIEALARELGSIAYDPRIKMEHLHFTVGKSAHDQTYKDAQEHWASDEKTMREVIMPQIPALAQKVREFLK